MSTQTDLPMAAGPQHAIEILLMLELEEFYDVVDRDIRNNGNGDDPLPRFYREALRTEEVCERWYQGLVRMKKSTEMTIAAKGLDDRAARAKLESQGNRKKAGEEHVRHLKWRAGALRFLTGVEERLAEANYIRRLHYGVNVSSGIAMERDRLSEHLRLLQQSIRTHHEEQLAPEVGSFGRITGQREPTAADLKLWSVVNDYEVEYEEHTG